MIIVVKTTNTREYKRAPTNLSHKESELVSLKAMLAMVITVDEGEESEFRTVTKITTMNMQIETGATILTISSPRDSRMLVLLGFWAIGCLKIGSMLNLGGVLIDGSCGILLGFLRNLELWFLVKQNCDEEDEEFSQPSILVTTNRKRLKNSRPRR